MVARARPKYLDPTWIEQVLSSSVVPSTDGWYVDRGRSALFLLLRCLRSRSRSGRPAVAIQSFNCPVVMEAVLQSGCFPVLVDVKESDLSMDLAAVRMAPVRLDAIVLTHYQGLPNEQYAGFREYCDRTGCLLIEDNAQAAGGRVDGVAIGTLGDFVVESYAFDKPWTCWTGGMVRAVREGILGLAEEVRRAVECLDEEDEGAVRADLRALRFLYDRTSEACYDRPIQDWGWIRTLNRFPLQASFVETARKVEPLRLAYRAAGKLFRWDRRIAPRRLGAAKVRLILLQKERYRYDPAPALILEEVLQRKKNWIRLGRAGVEPHWNRYSILDPDDQWASWLRAQGIEAGNHNWPQPLHRIYPRRVYASVGDLRVTEMAARAVVNIPIWPGADRLAVLLERVRRHI